MKKYTVVWQLLYGISGLTASQQYAGLNTIMDVVAAGKSGMVGDISYGGINSYMSSRDGGMIATYGEGISSYVPYLAAAMAIENAPITNDDGSEFTINDLATSWRKTKAAIARECSN